MSLCQLLFRNNQTIKRNLRWYLTTLVRQFAPQFCSKRLSKVDDNVRKVQKASKNRHPHILCWRCKTGSRKKGRLATPVKRSTRACAVTLFTHSRSLSQPSAIWIRRLEGVFCCVVFKTLPYKPTSTTSYTDFGKCCVMLCIYILQLYVKRDVSK